MENTIKLNNGTLIPEIGFGTWKTPDGDTAVKAVSAAIKSGYTHIDAAAIYANEESVGEGIKQSGINREDLFITSKLWNAERGYDTTFAAFDKTLKDLQIDYLDLYLIHWPANAKQFANWKELNAETWRAMEYLYAQGKIKAIGVSNFHVNHLIPLFEVAKVKPMVNQIEYHPGFMQQDCVDFCKANDVLVEAWSPLGNGKVLSNETLLGMADKYKVSVAQLCVRWVMQHGVLPLPKSVTPSRISENREVYHFEISREDVKTIDAMAECGYSGLHPDEIDF